MFIFIECFLCVLFRMSSLFSRDFPPLTAPPTQSTGPDFSKLKLGVDYYVTYTPDGTETRVLADDFEKVRQQFFSNNPDGAFSPLSTRSGAKYSLTAYPSKKKKIGNFQCDERSPIRGAFRGGANNPSNRGNYRGGGSSFTRGFYSPPQQSYAQAVNSPPRGGASQCCSSHPPSPKSSVTYPGGVRVIPNLDVNSVTVNSVYNEMKQCLTSVHGELHQQKIATGNRFDALHSTITDEINGLDAIALRLSDVESDISHSSGIRKSLKDLQSEVQKVKETKINVQVEGDEVDYI